ncbi:hypothetical protein [Pseudocalidococcus azoricus]
MSHRYTLAETAEAHRYIEMGHKRGNVVILVTPNQNLPTSAQ